MLCARFGWNCSSGSWKKDFLTLSMYFCYFVIIFPWKIGGTLHLNKFPLHQRMLRAKFGWNWPSGSGEVDENVKSLRQQRRKRWRQRTNFHQKSSLEPSAQVSYLRSRTKLWSYLYPTQRVAEGIMFLTRPSVSHSVSQSVSPVFLVSATPLKPLNFDSIFFSELRPFWT